MSSTASSNTILLITGGNAGLGYETIKSLLHSSSTTYTILLGARTHAKAQEAIERLQQEGVQGEAGQSTLLPLQIDITDDQSIQQAHQEVQQRFGHLDVLINNAGRQTDGAMAKGEVSIRQGWAEGYEVNVTSTHIMTEAFADLLMASTQPRLLFLASGTASLEEASQGLPPTMAKVPAGWPKPKTFNVTSYRAAKTALNMVMLEWDRIFKEDPVKVFAISPGFLATNLGGAGPEALRKMGAKDPQIGANLVRDVVEGKHDHNVGKVIRGDGTQPW